MYNWAYCFFFQAEDGIRDLVRSRGLGDVYKRQQLNIRSRDDKHQEFEVDMTVSTYEHAPKPTGKDLSLIHI